MQCVLVVPPKSRARQSAPPNFGVRPASRSAALGDPLSKPTRAAPALGATAASAMRHPYRPAAAGCHAPLAAARWRAPKPEQDSRSSPAVRDALDMCRSSLQVGPVDGRLLRKSPCPIRLVLATSRLPLHSEGTQ